MGQTPKSKSHIVYNNGTHGKVLSQGILMRTRNTVSNAHKMIPPAPPSFVWQSPCFALGHPKIMQIKILNRRCCMASCSEQFLKVSWNAVQRS